MKKSKILENLNFELNFPFGRCDDPVMLRF